MVMMWVSTMGNSNKFSVWFTTFLLLFILPQVVTSQASSACGNDTYEHEERKCCLCPAGQYVKSHCETNLQRGVCELCPDGEYTNQLNSLTSCESCTSCDQPNANLEEAEPCTPGRDRKCRCKKGHYCDIETCKLCQPCKKCDTAGVKVACTEHSNTVCNEPTEGSNTGAILGTTFAILIAVAVAVAVFYIWKRRQGKRQKRTGEQQSNGDANAVEMQPLTVPDVDLRPHLSDIAQETGWTVIQDIARRSDICPAVIESCQLDFPNNTQEQTVKLLGIFAENLGREGSRKLVQKLQDSGRRATAERVVEILSGRR